MGADYTKLKSDLILAFTAELTSTDQPKSISRVSESIAKAICLQIVEGENGYTLSPATATVLGGIKVGLGLSVSEDGTVQVSSNFLDKTVADTLYRPIYWSPDLSAYSTKQQNDTYYLGINATAQDSIKLGGQLPSYYQPAGNYESILTFSTGLNRVGSIITNTITQYTDAMADIRVAHGISGKQDVLNGIGLVRMDGGIVSYDNNTYLTSFTESDPIFTAWDKKTGISITKSQITDFPTSLRNPYALTIKQDEFTSKTYDGSLAITIDYASLGAAAANHTHAGYEPFLNVPPVSGYVLASTTGGARSWVAASGLQVQTDWNASSGMGVLLNKPTSLPASDVYAWAKAATKPSYTWSEIGATPTKLSQFTNDLGNYGSFVTGTPWTAMGYLTAITKAQVESVLTGAITSHTHNYLSSFTETDPVFSAWNKSDGISITKSQISDFPTSMPASDVYAWAKLLNKPSYGWNEIQSKPTTLAGYGITDAVTGTPWTSMGYLTGITSGQVTSALGYTPYNSSNPAGYITSSALTNYLLLSGGTLSGAVANSSYYGSTVSGAANFRGNWTGSAYWGIGSSAAHTIRIGMTDATGVYLAPPGDLIFQVDGQVTASQFNGSGAGLTSIPVGALTSAPWTNYLPLTGGTLRGQILLPTASTGVYGGALQIRERGYVAANQYDWDYAPKLSFHWGNRVVKAFGIRSDGQMAVDDTPISMSGHTHDYATHRGEGTDFIDYSRYVYNNGAYSGSGWVEPSDLGVRYASNAGSAGFAGYLPTCYVGGYQGNPQTYFGSSTGLKVAMTAYPSTWADTLWINGYDGGDVLDMCALHFLRNGTPRMYISTQRSNATSYGTTYEIISAYNIGSQKVDGATKLWSESHPNDWYLKNDWDGTYWQLTSNHSAPVSVGHADLANSANGWNGYDGSTDSSYSNCAYLMNYDTSVSKWRPMNKANVAAWLGVSSSVYTASKRFLINTTDGSGDGLSLHYGDGNYSGLPAYGIAFATLANFGGHGYVTADWATYFTMSGNSPGRGWIFKDKNSSTNVASISTAGNAVFNGLVKAASFVSADGSVGYTGVITLVDSSSLTHTFTIKNGLITGLT